MVKTMKLILRLKEQGFKKVSVSESEHYYANMVGPCFCQKCCFDDIARCPLMRECDLGYFTSPFDKSASKMILESMMAHE